MRHLIGLGCLLLALIAATAGARADFIKNYEEWRRLGPEGQAAYAMAIYDVMTVFVDDNEFVAARAMGLRACGVSLQLKGSMVAQTINKFYADHPKARVATPYVAFNSYLERGACSPFINEARKEMGLPPLKAPPLPAAEQ
ncbi:hypothetical protein [Aestuariivirga sp.]|uniref:hypothetical protein n=1 Tax=Aestuariivirga sp. TaxID=2650926 RepID=UPI003784C83B